MTSILPTRKAQNVYAKWQNCVSAAVWRVQNSVFEVLVDAAQLVVLKAELSNIIDHERDSVRFYRLGNSYQHKIETMGRTPFVQAGGALLL